MPRDHRRIHIPTAHSSDISCLSPLPSMGRTSSRYPANLTWRWAQASTFFSPMTFHIPPNPLILPLHQAIPDPPCRQHKIKRLRLHVKPTGIINNGGSTPSFLPTSQPQAILATKILRLLSAIFCPGQILLPKPKAE